MKALVIGGNRFFGKRLVRLLLDRGAQVTLLNRGKLADPFGDGVERIVLDRRELAAGHPALGSGAWDVVYDQACYDAAEARGACSAFRGRAGRYVFTSSQSVYGPGAELREEAFDPLAHPMPADVPRDQDYGEAKRQAEAVFFRERALPVTAVRFPIVLGEDDYTERLEFHLRRVRDGKPIHLPAPAARISFLHAADAAAFLAALPEAGIAGPVNCCAPSPIRLRDLISGIEAATGKRAVLSPEGDPSPFGAASDWYMDAGKAARHGFRAAEIQQWLPGLMSAALRAG